MRNFIHLCENTVVKKLFFIPSCLDNCKIYENNTFILTKSPYFSSMFNIAWLYSVKSPYFEKELKKIIKYFSPNPFALWMGPSSLPNEHEYTLKSLGFEKETNEVGMSLVLDQNMSSVSEDNIYEVVNEKSMQKFISVLEQYDAHVKNYYLSFAQKLGFSKDKPYRFFYLISSGKPVCISSLFFNNEMCGIFDVLTHEDFRKQGFASEMMLYLIFYAKSQGAKYMCLTASSPEAVKIYKKLGFIEQGNYECYEYKEAM